MQRASNSVEALAPGKTTITYTPQRGHSGVMVYPASIEITVLP